MPLFFKMHVVTTVSNSDILKHKIPAFMEPLIQPWV